MSQSAGHRRVPMAHILALRPGDYPAHATVADALPDIREKIREYEDGGEELRAKMAAGIQPHDIVVNDGVLDDGHRRAAVACELGWDSMAVRSGRFGPAARRSSATLGIEDLVCPICGDQVRGEPPVGIDAEWSHTDGTPLCADSDPVDATPPEGYGNAG